MGQPTSTRQARLLAPKLPQTGANLPRQQVRPQRGDGFDEAHLRWYFSQKGYCCSTEQPAAGFLAWLADAENLV